MPELRRVSDGAGDAGSMVDAIAWNDDGTFKEIAGHKPILGCSLKVGSPFARTYASQDWWMTTPITEIIEDIEKEDGHYVRFKTQNSEYEYFSGNASLWAKTKKRLKK